MKIPMDELREDSYLFSANAAFVEDQYAAYLQDPSQVSDDWRAFFSDMQARGETPVDEVDHQAVREDFKRMAKQPRTVAACTDDA